MPIIKIKGNSGGGGGGGITSINADTTAAQTLVTGTSGTNFAIVDGGGGAHTFNLPVASATNTGKLSNTDWSTFNGKQAAGNYITALTGEVTASGPGSVAATIANGVITNAKVSASAAIDFSKLASLTSAHILVGSAGNVATDVAVSGDLTATNAGAFTVAKIQTTTVSGTTGSGNVVFSASPTMTGTAVVAALSQSGQSYLSALTTSTPSGTTQTIDFNNGNIQTLNLGSASGNVTLTLSNPQITSYRIIITQGATPRTLVWPTIKWIVSAGAPTLSGANATDIVDLTYDGTTYWGSYGLNFG